MARKKIYANAAERQRAWRERLKAQAAGKTPPPPILPRVRRAPSRPVRLAVLLAALNELQDEYEQWLDAMPASLTISPLVERLTETIGQFQAASDLLEGLDLPRGFGRD